MCHLINWAQKSTKLLITLLFDKMLFSPLFLISNYVKLMPLILLHPLFFEDELF